MAIGDKYISVRNYLESIASTGQTMDWYAVYSNTIDGKLYGIFPTYDMAMKMQWMLNHQCLTDKLSWLEKKRTGEVW